MANLIAGDARDPKFDSENFSFNSTMGGAFKAPGTKEHRRSRIVVSFRGFQVAHLVFMSLHSRTLGTLTPSFLARGAHSEVATPRYQQCSSE